MSPTSLAVDQGTLPSIVRQLVFFLFVRECYCAGHVCVLCVVLYGIAAAYITLYTRASQVRSDSGRCSTIATDRFRPGAQGA